MHLFRRCFLALFLLFAVPLAAASGGSDWLYQGSDIPRDPSWQFGTLPNGLRYAVRQNALPAGQVSIRVRIDAGSLNEEDKERGWAHFVEHLAFRGTKNFEDREARYLWQQLGASFGSDTNASTSASQTVYQLDLPKADRESIDKSLAVLVEMMDSARFEPAAVEGERQIVLAEKRRRSELAVRLREVSQPLFYAGLKYEKRDTIGTDATLAAASADGLRAFYERWYRPDLATVVIVGDADPALLTELLTRHFGAWQPSGPPPKAPDYGTIAQPKDQVASLAYPDAPYEAQLVWLRPHQTEPTTIASERTELAERLAAQIINRRLEAKARKDASFIAAGLSISRERRIADTTQLSITVRDGQWREALDESFAILADALHAPPSASEIARELSNLRTSAQSAVAGESTIRSPQWAQRMVNAVNNADVLTTAAAMLQLIDKLAADMTPTRVADATKTLFSGVGPRMLLVAPQRVDRDMLAAALASAQKMTPARRQAERIVSFDSLPRLGPPGKEISRQHIEDMDVTIVRFANGSSLTFKRTEYDMGSVSVQLRFGSGLAGLPPHRPSLGWTASVVAASGFADLDLDAMERLMTGRRMNLNLGMAENGFVLTGSTNAQDLPDQLRMLALKLAYPRWDDGLFNRYKAGWLENYEMSFASAAARANRESGAVLHPGDQRWMPIEKTILTRTGPDDVRRYFEPLLGTGPIEAIIVGDVSLEQAVAAAAATVGALPPRPPESPVNLAAPPRPDPKPRIFTHTGDPNQAYAMIGWSTMGGTDRIKERRALSLAARLLQTRLFNRLREEEGVTYSPSFTSSGSESFPAWGAFTASAQLRPESADSFFRIAREEVADLARRPAPDDEFRRGLNPAISSIERTLKTNGYWAATLGGWTSKPELIEQTRNYLSDYKAMTPQAVRAAVSAYVADEGDWSMLVLPEKAKPNGD